MNPIQYLAAKIIPTITKVIRHSNQEMPAQAHMLDVDAVHGALRAAESGDCTTLFAIYRDIISGHSHIQSEFTKRKLAVLNEPLTLTPDDPKNEAQAEFVKSVQNHINKLPDLIWQLSHLLDSALYPVAVTERLYRESEKPGWRWEIAEFNILPHSHLIWDEGILSRKETNEEGSFTGVNTPITSRRYIVHRGHLLTSVPDWWGGPMRALLFWYLFSIMGRDWWARFLDRFGSPFLIGKYENGDDQSRYELQTAFSQATRIFGIAATTGTEISMEQANTSSGGDAFEKFHTVANREFSKLIVGQTLSSEGQDLGIGGGGGQAEAQEGVRDDIRKFDANSLAHTFRTQILQPLWILNAWSWPLPAVSWGADTEEAEVSGDIVSSLSTAGLEPTDEGMEIIGRKLGFPIRRVSAQPNITALSATDTALTLIPPAERRMERKRQARGACAAAIAAASPASCVQEQSRSVKPSSYQLHHQRQRMPSPSSPLILILQRQPKS